MALNKPRGFKSSAIAVESLSSSGATIAGSRKRKSSPPPKFYAVKIGHKPGVYLNWKECEQNITRYKNASFKSFSTLAEANAYLAGKELSENSSNSPVNRFYGVARGRVPGVYTDWSDAAKQIKGWKGGPKYKKFATSAEAEAFVRQYGDAPIGESSGLASREADDEDEDEDEEEIAGFEADKIARGNPVKRARRTNSEDELVASYLNIEEGDISEPIQNTGVPEFDDIIRPGILRIWTDGSSRNNGRVGAAAGVGVYFGDGDPRNVVERLQGEPQTNQRAELTAILRALEIAPRVRDVQIRTDSQYSINCLTVWYKNWERNNWQTALKKLVLNRDLVQEALAKIRAREASGSKTDFVWIKGHANEPGNIAADRLAVLGAQKPYPRQPGK